MADGGLTMFGKAYDTVGSTNKNLILLTRGDLKVRWGNKYIDLIKNGKINVDVDLLKKVSNKDEIFKDGIYIIDKEDNQEVWLSIGGTLINLVGEIGTTYVSFIGTLDVDAEKRFLALINAGFYYQTISDAKAANIQSGLVYIVDLHQLYYAIDGQLSKYEQALNISDPLIVGAITIDGTSSRIYGTAGLNLGVSSNDYISLTDKGVNISQPLITSNLISSDTFKHNLAGYSIYYDPVRNWHCMEIDYILIRNLLEYEGLEDITYDELLAKVADKGLIKGKKYRITDFQNEWEIEDAYYDSNNNSYLYYWPITLTAKNEEEFEDLGYFCNNEKWIIEYDINYHYYINSGVNENGDYWILYTKGRITKLTDEYNNTCNYDFKHRKFKLQNSDPLEDQLFTFNIVNSEIGNDEENPLSFRNIHSNWDATQVDDVKIKNNIINIKEPSFESRTILNSEGESEEVEAAIIYDEGFIFPDCSTIYPFDNEIKESSGKYFIYSNFYNNKIGGFLQNVEDRVTKTINYSFHDNVFKKIYIIGEYVAPINNVITLPQTSNKTVVFTNNKEYAYNEGLDITNTTFNNGAESNVFLNIKNVIFDYKVESNIFKEDLNDVHFYCSKLKNNKFLGRIDTDSELSSNRETYPIKGELENNTFNNIIKVEIDGVVKDNKFNDLKPATDGTLTVIKSDVSNCVIKDLIGVRFDNGYSILYAVGYDEEHLIEYDIEKAVILGDINKLIFKGKILNVDFKDDISNVLLLGLTGVSDFRTKFSEVSDTTFYLNVLKLDADDSNIQNCKFNGEVTYAKIRGNITNCSFMRLSGNIEIGLANSSLSDAEVQVDIYPTISEWAQNENDPNVLISCNPLKVNITNVPRLKATAHKECFIQTINPGSKATFIVLLSSDDTTPSGVILMWSGSIASIPKGYAICDGSTYNGVTTPDLRGRFIRMVDQSNNTWEATGVKNNSDLVNNGSGTRTGYIQIHDYNLPPHIHTFEEVEVNDNITILNSTESATVTYYYEHVTVENSTISVGGSDTETLYSASVDGESGTSDSHTHDIDITCPINFTFTPTLETDSFDNTKINIEPNAYALIFIMKL